MILQGAEAKQTLERKRPIHWVGRGCFSMWLWGKLGSPEVIAGMATHTHTHTESKHSPGSAPCSAPAWGMSRV